MTMEILFLNVDKNMSYSTSESIVVLPNIRDETHDGMRTAFIMSSIFIFLWIVVGIAAFIMSIVCFGRSGSTAEHIVGLLLSIFFGPFYWIYFLAVSSYCRAKPQIKRGRK